MEDGNAGSTPSKIEALDQEVKDQDLQHWKTRALNAEAVATTALKEARLNPNALTNMIAAHVSASLVFERDSYRKALIHVRDILGMAADLPADELPKVVNKVAHNINLTLARFGGSDLTSQQENNDGTTRS